MPVKLSNATLTKIHGGACPFMTQASLLCVSQAWIAEEAGL